MLPARRCGARASLPRGSPGARLSPAGSRDRIRMSWSAATTEGAPRHASCTDCRASQPPGKGAPSPAFIRRAWSASYGWLVDQSTGFEAVGPGDSATSSPKRPHPERSKAELIKYARVISMFRAGRSEAIKASRWCCVVNRHRLGVVEEHDRANIRHGRSHRWRGGPYSRR
jgi:hypothetical protein